MASKQSPITIGEGEKSIEVFPRKSHLARRIMIKVSKRNGVELIVPSRVSMKSALAFLYTKESWIIQKCLEMGNKNQIIFKDGAVIPILGNNYTITHSGSLRGVSRLEGNNLIVSGLPEHIERKTRQFLIQKAKEEITIRAKIEAEKLGVKFSSITIRDTSSRWGSCSSGGGLSFSWRLVLAPREVMEYVVAHEVSHILEMNHGDKFWEIVASICPHHKKSRKWLKSNGELLHSYGG